MPNRAVSVLEFVTAVQASVAQDFGRESGEPNALVVQHIELELKTLLARKSGGGFEWKLVTATGEAADTQTQTLSLCWERRPVQKSFAPEALPVDLPYHTDSVCFAQKSGQRRFLHSTPGTRFSLAHSVRIFRCFQHLSIGVRISSSREWTP